MCRNHFSLESHTQSFQTELRTTLFLKMRKWFPYNVESHLFGYFRREEPVQERAHVFAAFCSNQAQQIQSFHLVNPHWHLWKRVESAELWIKPWIKHKKGDEFVRRLLSEFKTLFRFRQFSFFNKTYIKFTDCADRSFHFVSSKFTP